MEEKVLKIRGEVQGKYKWRIEKIYENHKLWEEDLKRLQGVAHELEEFKGKLNSGEKILEYLKKDEDICRLADKLFLYANLKLDEDMSNTEAQGMKKKIEAYLAEFMTMRAFFVPEVLALDENYVKKEIDRISGLKSYEFYLKTILEEKPHSLSKEQEELLAGVSDCLNAPEGTWDMLISTDMMFPTIKGEQGEKIQLTDTNFNNYLKSKNRTVRKEAFEGVFNAYEKYKNTFANLMTASIKTFIFKSKIRTYSSSLESALKPDNIPTEVFHKTIETINNNLCSLHRFVSLKKKLLGLEEMHMYDLYMPLVQGVQDYIPYEEAVQLSEKALQPLGKEYLDIFKKGINEGWVDALENKGKKGGNYSWGCYDTPAFVHLNYNFHYNDVSMLAHEMGHSIHSYYSNKNQPYIYSNYSYFCAEVASTTNEALLSNYSINTENDKMKKLYYINAQLEQIRTTVFRQALFAEFEMIVHEEMEKGIILSAEDFCNIYYELNVKYYGKDIIVDKCIGMEWARISQYYRDFYIYQYVTGFAAAFSFSKMILQEGESAVERYLNFLKSGSSDYSIELLKKAGVDMTTSKPLEDTIKRFNELLEMLEELI